MKNRVLVAGSEKGGAAKEHQRRQGKRRPRGPRNQKGTSSTGVADSEGAHEAGLLGGSTVGPKELQCVPAEDWGADDEELQWVSAGGGDGVSAPSFLWEIPSFAAQALDTAAECGAEDEVGAPECSYSEGDPVAAETPPCIVVVWGWRDAERSELTNDDGANQEVAFIDPDTYDGKSCRAAVEALTAAELQGSSLLWCHDGCPEDISFAISSMQDHARQDDGRCFGCVSSVCGTLTFVSAASAATVRRILQRASKFPGETRAFGAACQEMAQRRTGAGGRFRSSAVPTTSGSFVPWRLIEPCGDDALEE